MGAIGTAKVSAFLDIIHPTPLPDGVNWRHESIFRYQSTLLGAVIESPVGRITDFTSTPQAIWNQIPPWGKHGPAACVHDEMYWTQDFTREQADDVLREAMELLGVTPTLIGLIYDGVRMFGQHAWDHNAELLRSGYTRLSTGVGIPPYGSIF